MDIAAPRRELVGFDQFQQFALIAEDSSVPRMRAVMHQQLRVVDRPRGYERLTADAAQQPGLAIHLQPQDFGKADLFSRSARFSY